MSRKVFIGFCLVCLCISSSNFALAAVDAIIPPPVICSQQTVVPPGAEGDILPIWQTSSMTFAVPGEIITPDFNLDIETDHPDASNLEIELVPPVPLIPATVRLWNQGMGPTPFSGNFPNTLAPLDLAGFNLLKGQLLTGTWTLRWRLAALPPAPAAKALFPAPEALDVATRVLSWTINNCAYVPPGPPPAPTGVSDWVKETSGTTDLFNGVWATGGPVAFACGLGGRIQHYDGTVWSAMTSNTVDNLHGIWGNSTTDVFAVGDGGRIQHYDGTWSQMTSNTTDNLKGVHGTSGTDVFAVGVGGRIQHYDGAWSQMTSNTGADLSAVWAAAADDVFAVGAGGVIMHYNGLAWATMASYTTNNLLAVWGASGSDVYAVGEDGAIGHYDGTTWTRQASGITSADFFGVYYAGAEVFVVGQAGWILHYDGTTWTAMISGTVKDLHAVRGALVWGSTNTFHDPIIVFAAGEDGDIRSYHFIYSSCFIRTLQR